MIDPVSIFLFLAGAAAAVAVVAFWEEIRSFFIDSFRGLPPHVQKDLKGLVVLARAVDIAITTTLKYYSYNNMTDTWTETKEERPVSAEEVPEHIRKRVETGQQIDITNDFARELNLTL